MSVLWVVPVFLALLAVIALGASGRGFAGLRWTGTVGIGFSLLARTVGWWRTSDALVSWFYFVVALLSMFALWYSGPYLEREAEQHQWSLARVRRYYGFLFLFIAALASLALWTNLLFLWLAMEACTLSSVVLTAAPQNQGAVRAAFKYVVITELGGLVALTGTILALTAVGSPLFAWHPAPAHAVSAVHQHWALIGGLLALVGYGAKAGLAPFHTWLPDAHSEAPAPVSALLSGLKLAGGVVIVLRLDRVLAGAIPSGTLKDGLIVLGLLSLVVAAAFMAVQRDLKRLWAYSSIEHIGLIALGIGFGGIALIGAMLHIFTHAVSKTLLFHNAGTVRLLYRSSDFTAGAKAVMQRTPWTGALLAIGAAAIVGLPPFAPFWSEWLILAGGFHLAANRVFVLIAAALLVIIFVATVRQMPQWLFTPGRGSMGTEARIAEPGALVFPGVILAILVVAGGIGIPMALHPLWTHLVQQWGGVTL